MYFLTTLLAVCPNINPTILCAHVCDVNYAARYTDITGCPKKKHKCGNEREGTYECVGICFSFSFDVLFRKIG